jgi:hypothetical protein
MKLYGIAIAALGTLALAGCGDSSSPGLTGADRTTFVDASTNSCMQAAQGNPNISADVIRTYCTCYSNKMADSISAAEAQSLNTSTAAEIQAKLQPRIQAAIAACRPANM